MPRTMGSLPISLLLLVGCAVSTGLAASKAPLVSLYMSEAHDVLDLRWDDSAKHLAVQLEQLGYDLVKVTTGQPNLVSGAEAPQAYVIPAQNGPALYSSVEDMGAVRSFLASGGLVILLDASNDKSEALQQFVAKALGYEGAWGVCKQLYSNNQRSYGEPVLSDYALSFLSANSNIAWPPALEDARVTGVNTWCIHDDVTAMTLPLYTVQDGDDVKAVAQAFGKAGNPGAIVWLGYSWLEGPQAEWGSLINKLIADFANGVYEVPLSGNSDIHSIHMDSVLEAAADVAEGAAEAVRRFLAVTPAVYPPPSLVPGGNAAPPPASPRPRPPAYVTFTEMKGMGAVGQTRPLVWFNDPDFDDQLVKHSPLQLVNWHKKSCPDMCAGCPRAWKGTDSSFTVAIFFKDPVQITKIQIREIRNPNVQLVQFIKWAYPPAGVVAGNIGATVFNSSDDTTPCPGTLAIKVPYQKSGIRHPVPPNGSASNLPKRLQATACGGILITMKRRPSAGSKYGPFVEWVKFDGRALYPSNTTIYP